MVTNAVTIMPGKALAHRNTGSAVATIMGAGLALIRDQLSDNVVEHFVVAKRCGVALDHVHWLHLCAHASADYVEKAKAYYRAALPRAAHVADAASFLKELRHPHEPITYAQANAMIHVLFASMTGKLREDAAAMIKLAACAEIFSPANNALGQALDLWEPVSTHPVSLVLAIKELKANRRFEPNEAELREALGKVETKNAGLERNAREWLTRLRQTDALMFATDRDGWSAAHAAADSAATAAAQMREADNGGAYAEAVQAMWEEKYDREQAAAAEKYHRELAEQEQTNRPALAACARPAAKRTKRLKAKDAAAPI
jgi:hypothetical protein